jgi:hypothetical protein
MKKGMDNRKIHPCPGNRFSLFSPREDLAKLLKIRVPALGCLHSVIREELDF